MYRLLIILLLAGCVKDKAKHPFAVDNGMGWQGMYEYLTPKEEGFYGMEGAPDGVIAVFHGYKDTSKLRGYTIGIPNDPNWHTGFEGYNNGGPSEFRFNAITSGEVNFIIIDTSNH